MPRCPKASHASSPCFHHRPSSWMTILSIEKVMASSNPIYPISSTHTVPYFKRESLPLGTDTECSSMVLTTQPPPTYSYLKAVSAHSAAVQLYARSGQLATPDILYSRGKAGDNLCPFGCGVTGSMHHLFVQCTVYSEWRVQASSELVIETRKKLRCLLTDGDCSSIEDGLVQIAKSIFSADSSKWPLQKNVFYLGKHPSLKELINETSIQNTVLRRRIISHISSEWHSKSIRLAGRIFRDYQKRMAVINGCRKRAD